MLKLIAVSILCVLSSNLYSQVFSPESKFSKDSVKIGEEVAYSLSIRYPKFIDVVFPDSLYDFKPFELNYKESYPTNSDSLFSFDSAVYFLSTFSVDSFQSLDLPVFMVTDGDSVVILAGPDSIKLIQVVKSIPDSISMMENTAFSNVALSFNYPYLIVGLTILFLVLVILYFTFGKSIQKKVLLYRLRRIHKRFIEPFVKSIQDLEPADDYLKLERLLTTWKEYMERLNKKPYTKLTSKEINVILSDKELAKALQKIDVAIYGSISDFSITNSFDYLRRISEDTFVHRVQEIKNG